MRRRTILVTALAATVGIAVAIVVAVQNDVLPGRIRLQSALGACNVDAPIPNVGTGPIRYAEFTSKARGTKVTWGLALPPDAKAKGLPVVLVLHGRGDDARTAFDRLGYAQFLADYTRNGGKPFALVTIDGGTSYWHQRANGDDPPAMIRDELLPRLAALGLKTDQVGATGWSMGGFGALLMARDSGTGSGAEVVAAAASSPALFARYADATPGAFDDEADWRRYGDLVTTSGQFDGNAVFIATGRTDAFAGSTRQLRDAIEPTPAGGVGKGCHDDAYWRGQIPAQLDFLGQRLSST